MCGVGGIARHSRRGIAPEALGRMGAALRHRGPDGYGFLIDPTVGLVHTRLSIIDLERGDQPLSNEDGRLWLTYNGEIYNYVELRAELESRGHRFRTTTDTEVVVHAWEEWGRGALDRFNGQFAFAMYDRQDRSVFLARDRFGVRPLFHASTAAGDLFFASEAKALFAGGEISAQPDVDGLAEVYTLWAARAPRTVFLGVQQLVPGGWALWKAGNLTTGTWFETDWSESADEPDDAIETLDALLRSSVALRMRADVPVGGYLSGGLDSSITCRLAAEASPMALRTFSVTFDDPALDESAHQLAMARAIGSEHSVLRIGPNEIAEVFPAVIRHAETPILRTAPAPMFLLARLARERGITVVLTGEGADELFLGYDIFKETKVREFCLRQPDSTLRPRLLDRLYPYLQSAGGDLWRRFFLESGARGDPLFSHQPRFRLAEFLTSFLTPGVRSAIGMDVASHLVSGLPAGFSNWSTLGKAAFLEVSTLLEGYLLSSQGDRMAMAHGVEGRFPFLDHRVYAFAANLPSRSKLPGLREKDVLRRWAGRVLPRAATARTKQPYRAQDASAFFGSRIPDYVTALLSPAAVRESGIFESAAVDGLVRRCRAGHGTSTRESHALVGILSTQLWYRHFVASPETVEPLSLEQARVCAGAVVPRVGAAG